MSERAAEKLNAQKLNLLLRHLKDYLASPNAVVVLGSSPTVSDHVILDGEAFLLGFAGFLKEKDLNPEDEIVNLSLVMELSTYVRNGGVKALLYRVETGRCKLTPDYYDLLSNQLCYEYKDGKLCSSLRIASSSFFQRLQAIDPNDEALVKESIEEIDEFLLDIIRRLEQVSLDSLAAKAGSSDSGASQ